MSDDKAYRLSPAALAFTKVGNAGREVIEFAKSHPGLAEAINQVCEERAKAAEHETFEKMLYVLGTLGHYQLVEYFRNPTTALVDK